MCYYYLVFYLIFKSLQDLALQLLQLVRWDEIMPICQALAYDAKFQYSVKAVMWIFSESLIMQIFVCSMIIFRLAIGHLCRSRHSRHRCSHRSFHQSEQ